MAENGGPRQRKPGTAPKREQGKPLRTGSGPSRGASLARGSKLVQDEPQTKPISPARTAAFEILMLVGAGRGHSDDLLHSSRLAGIAAVDRALACALVMGVLRWQIALDARLRPCFARPETPVAEEALVAMRLGAFQLLHMDRIPPHAALSESVELCRWAGQPHAAGMVNAVLRRLVREPASGVPIFEATAAFAERLGHPAWLVERWAGVYGRDAARRICEAGQRETSEGTLFCEEGPTPRDGEGVPAPDKAWDAADAELAFGQGAADQRKLPIMDDGSRLVAELTASLLPLIAHRRARVWDCCAAPGGKTMVLALRLAGRAELLATDINARRLTAMQSRLMSAGYSEVRCAPHDAASLPRAEGDFDLILCDVPCSGTGTLARNPEIRHRLTPDDLARQAERQHALLRGALNRLTPGGRLIYSTCSLEPEECEQVAKASAASAGVRRMDISPALTQLVTDRMLREQVLPPNLVRSGMLRTLPGVHPCDGFFAAVFERPGAGNY